MDYLLPVCLVYLSGFLTTMDDVIPANLGMKDQYLALEWVHDNIELFGGNKSHVTIVGESAGSKAVDLHISGPWQNDKVLYHAAILQSGSTIFLRKGNDEREAAFRMGRILDSEFNSTDSKELLKLLQNVSAEDILKVRNSSYVIMDNQGLFSHHTYDSLANGDIKKIPILIGFNSEECLYSILSQKAELMATDLDRYPGRIFGQQFNLSETNRTIAGTLMKNIYTNTSFRQNMSATIRFNSDINITIPITKQAFLQSKYVDVYFYQFAYKGELGMQMSLPVVEGAERVGHAEDLKYMWDDQTNSDLSKFPAKDRLMLHQFVKIWTNFVKYHNPTPEQDPLLQNITWPKVDPEQPCNIHYLNMNETLEIRSNPRYYPKVKKIIDYYITPNNII